MDFPMKIIYSDEDFTLRKDPRHDPSPEQDSIFLAGPTPRRVDVKSWRPEALELLDKLGFRGIVLVPERRDWQNWDYLTQVEWEWKGLNTCDLVVFWIPRELVTMPAFTTNVEFGRYVDNSVYGRPDNAPKNDYLDWLYTKVTGKKPFNDLETMLEYVVDTFRRM